MKQHAVLDISVFIWNEAHFHKYKSEYYKFMEILPGVYDGLLTYKVPVAVRPELIDEILGNFPYKNIPDHLYYDFQVRTLSFIGVINMVDYPDKNKTSITSLPNLVKDFFTASTKKEIRYLITHLYNQGPETHRILSAKLFWDPPRNLTLRDSKKVEIESMLFDNFAKNFGKLVDNFRKIFEHNSKHDQYKSGHRFDKVISPLSCYNNRSKDKSVAQMLLDEALLYEGDYYNYDQDHQTYVKFVNTRANIFHGYDVQLSEYGEINLRKVFHK